MKRAASGGKISMCQCAKCASNRDRTYLLGQAVVVSSLQVVLERYRRRAMCWRPAEVIDASCRRMWKWRPTQASSIQ